MARLPRLVLPGCPHVVLLDGLEHTTIFADAEDRMAFLGALRESARAASADVHAYALRDRAVRLLVSPSNAHSLARLMQHLGRRYVSAHHRRHGGRGTLWDGRYRAAPVEPGAPALFALAWVDSQGDGSPEQSSRAHRDGRARQSWLLDPPEFWQLGNTPFEREAAWQARLESGITDDGARALLRAAQGGWAFGSTPFIERAAAACGRPAAPRAAGRPRQLR